MSFDNENGHAVAVRVRVPVSRRGVLSKVPAHERKTLHDSVRLDTLLSTLLASHGATAKDAGDTFAIFQVSHMLCLKLLYHFGDRFLHRSIDGSRGRFC